jgi:hypothetical protein
MGRSKKHEPLLTRWARALLNWGRDHPVPGVVTLGVGALLAIFSVAQGIEWAASKIWPPAPEIITLEKDRPAGGNFSITVENPNDMAMVVSEAVFRAERPPDRQNANAVELMIPAVTYTVPFDCSPGTKRVKLNPPFKVSSKDVGAVVLKSTLPMKDCQLFVSLETTQGRTKEKEGLSLASWRDRAP